MVQNFILQKRERKRKNINFICSNVLCRDVTKNIKKVRLSQIKNDIVLLDKYNV